MRLNTTAPSPQLQCIPAFSDNYIWLLHDGQHAWVVDPGDAGPVRAALQEQGLILAGILLTHHHHDHTGGVAELVADSGAAVFGPVGEVLPEPVTRVGEGYRLQVLGQDFEVIAVPGHTVSHIAFHGEGLLFCGDTLFSLGCGRLFEGTPRDMLGSLERLAALPAQTLVCCGHEYTLANAAFARVVEPDNPALRRRQAEATTMRDRGLPTLPSILGNERDCNPFLRIDVPAVRAAVAAREPGAADDRIEAFAALRRWKDGFRA